MIETKLHDDILEVIIVNPPINALGGATRQQLVKAVTDAQTDRAVKAIVIRGTGKLFSGGADITEFGGPPIAPSLPEVVETIEASVKPVVAAIHGMALGGGLEIAMACHYRMATPSAKLGLPEVKLGILPGAGGTQRLPRLAGVETALGMIVLGNPIPANTALGRGLIDRLAEEDSLLDEAIIYARTLDHVRRSGDRQVTAEAEVFERFAAEHSRQIVGLAAPQACIEAIRAATTMPLAAGLKKERELFATLVGGTQSKSLRHAFFAERAAAKIDGLPKAAPLRPIRRVGVVGAGTMGSGIAMNFMSAGIPVMIVEMEQDALDRGTSLIRANYDATAAKGRMTSQQVDTAMNFLAPTLDFDGLAECDLIIEAVYENIEVKKQLFVRLDDVAKAGAILASNTSFLDINEIASATSRPEDVLGLHFFSPANVMKLVEVVRSEGTALDVLATGMAIARKIGKVPVVAGACHGFIGNRMLGVRQKNAYALVLEGASPSDIDRVHTAFGMPMGPFQMLDLAGVDLGWHRDPRRVETLIEALCAKGRWGQKTKAGFYDYDDRRKPSQSPIVQALIAEFRAGAGVTPREISEQEIVARTLYTMVNEGAKILEEGIAQRASDIDVVWLYGYGWPRHKGGPMFWADEFGLANIVASLRAFETQIGKGFSLSPLLVECAESGRRLGD